jgi:hypothetical protein
LVLWFIVPLYWFAQRVGDIIPYQATLSGNLLATFGSPMLPIFAIVILFPFWIKFVNQPKTSGLVVGADATTQVT